MTDMIASLLKKLQTDSDNEELEEKIQKQICLSVVQKIKESEEPYDLEPFKNLYDNPFFWEDIEKKIQSRTEPFLFLKNFRKLSTLVKAAYTEQIFHIVYMERETIAYASDTLDIDKKLAVSVFRILNYSEDMILNRCMSKRRFAETLSDITGISKEETDFIWMLYQKHLEDVEPVVRSKKLLYLEQKINHLTKQITYLTDYLSYIADSIDQTSLDDITD